MAIDYVQPLLAATLCGLAPLSNKLASTEKGSFAMRTFGSETGETTPLVYIFNVACIVVMLVLNSLSIKHMMQSIGRNGAFVSGVLNFVFNFLVSSALDYLFDGKLMPAYKVFGACLMMVGFACIKGQVLEKADIEEKENLKDKKDL